MVSRRRIRPRWVWILSGEHGSWRLTPKIHVLKLVQPELVLVSQIEQAALLQAEVAAVGWGVIEFPDGPTVTLGHGIQWAKLQEGNLIFHQ
jgi:hypothetical protein